MNDALVVNVEGDQLGTIVVSVLLGDGSGPVGVAALEGLAGRVVGGVVGLSVDAKSPSLSVATSSPMRTRAMAPSGVTTSTRL